MLSAPPFVVVTIKFPAFACIPYISAELTPVRAEPSPVKAVAATVPVTETPVFVVINF